MKTHNFIGSFSALLLTLDIVRTEGAELYVSVEGSDSNPGTSTQPFRTISHAYSFAAPGVRIIVMPGVYTDYRSGWGLHLNASGTASDPIVLMSQVRGQAVIDGQNASDRNMAIYLDDSYNIIDGFVIRGGPNGGISVWGDYNLISNNDIHHNGNPASTSSLGKNGIYSDRSTRNNMYAANDVHDNGRPGSSLDHGLYLSGDNELVINNVLFRNAANGLQIAGYSTVSSMKVYNNVLAFNGANGIILWQALSGVDIKNNIIYRNGSSGINSWNAHGSGVVVDHNLLFGNGSGEYDFTRGGSDYSYSRGTTISADPLFVNSTSTTFDPHLAAGSPAINAGLNLSSVFTTDKAGAARPASGPWDLGAYQYGSDGSGSYTNTTPPAVTNSNTVSLSNSTSTTNSTTNTVLIGVTSSNTVLVGVSDTNLALIGVINSNTAPLGVTGTTNTGPVGVTNSNTLSGISYSNTVLVAVDNSTTNTVLIGVTNSSTASASVTDTNTTPNSLTDTNTTLNSLTNTNTLLVDVISTNTAPLTVTNLEPSTVTNLNAVPTTPTTTTPTTTTPTIGGVRLSPL